MRKRKRKTRKEQYRMLFILIFLITVSIIILFRCVGNMSAEKEKETDYQKEKVQIIESTYQEKIEGKDEKQSVVCEVSRVTEAGEEAVKEVGQQKETEIPEERITAINAAPLNPRYSDNPKLNALLDERMPEITQGCSDTYQKVEACYRYLIENCSFSQTVKYGFENDAYIMLTELKGSCTYYAAAFHYMMLYIGLDDRIYDGYRVSGNTQSFHRWNEITIDGVIYMFDTQVEDRLARDGNIKYELFFKTREELAEDYAWEKEKALSEEQIKSAIVEELVWEMGAGVPSPSDFFQKELIGNGGITETALRRMRITTPEEEMLEAGYHLVDISYGDIKVTAHLVVLDTNPPVIKVPEIREYKLGEAISYKKDVEVEDNSGEQIELKVNSEKVISNVPGSYPVYYTAEDRAGNRGEATGWIVIKRLQEPTEEDTRLLAEKLLDNILPENGSALEQAEAIFEWCNSNIRYTVSSQKSSLIQGAYDGLYYKQGDCYTYYAAAAFLLEYCGIDNIPLSKKEERATHYWSLVNIGGGWYHFDCSPHKGGWKCFMKTDAQTEAYGREQMKKPDYFIFDEEGIPERAEKIIID